MKTRYWHLTSTLHSRIKSFFSKVFISRGLANGVEMLELDCHLTKDHQVVVHHDFSVNRTTGEDGFIRDTAYDVCSYRKSQNKRIKNISYLEFTEN